MKRNKRDVAGEIIADLKEMHATLRAMKPLRMKYKVRKVRIVCQHKALAARSEPGEPS